MREWRVGECCPMRAAWEPHRQPALAGLGWPPMADARHPLRPPRTVQLSLHRRSRIASWISRFCGEAVGWVGTHWVGVVCLSLRRLVRVAARSAHAALPARRARQQAEGQCRSAAVLGRWGTSAMLSTLTQVCFTPLPLAASSRCVNETASCGVNTPAGRRASRSRTAAVGGWEEGCQPGQARAWHAARSRPAAGAPAHPRSRRRPAAASTERKRYRHARHKEAQADTCCARAPQKPSQASSRKRSRLVSENA